MPFRFFTHESPGAPQLTWFYGSITAMLDWALPQAGWTILFSSGSRRVYKMPGGSQRCLQVVHDGSVTASGSFVMLRGCQSATDVNTLIEPFPTPSQLSNSASSISIANSAGNKPFRLVVSDTFLFLACHSSDSSTTDGWEGTWFGDAVPTDPNDTFATCITVRDGSTMFTSSISTGPIALKTYWIRSIDGNILSTIGCLHGVSTSPSNSTSPGSVTGAPPARGGYLNRIVREPLGASCSGAASGTIGPLAIIRRGYLPNIWNPLHNGLGGLSTDDIFTDSAYAPGSQFSTVAQSTGSFVFMEHTDTWHL